MTDTLKSQAALGWDLYRRGRFHDSETLLRQVLAIRHSRYGPKNPDTLAAMSYLGVVLTEEGRDAEAEIARAPGPRHAPPHAGRQQLRNALRHEPSRSRAAR